MKNKIAKKFFFFDFPKFFPKFLFKIVMIFSRNKHWIYWVFHNFFILFFFTVVGRFWLLVIMSLSTQRLEGFTICKSVTAARRILELKFCLTLRWPWVYMMVAKKRALYIVWDHFSVCRREQQRKFDKRGKMTGGVKLLTSKLI